jgi:octaprenyl-diphosphate synthase
MAEGKLTLPVIYALNTTGDKRMIELARKVKKRVITPDEIAELVAFTKANGGIEYAEQKMRYFHDLGVAFVEKNVKKSDVKQALMAYLDYIVLRNK